MNYFQSNKFKRGDTVLNISKNSQFYEKVGTVVDVTDFSTVVRYPHTHVLGRHPEEILKHYTKPQTLEEDLFTI